jgi:hypothetical protein
MIPAMRVCLICKFSFAGETAGGSNQNQMQKLKIQDPTETSDQRPQFSRIGIETGFLSNAKRNHRESVALIGLVKEELCARTAMIDTVC